MSTPAPVWFISHGAPDLVIRRQCATTFLEGLTLPDDLKGLVVISAHWFSQELQINLQPGPELMYDFYGFPDALYEIRWPGHTPAWLGERLLALFAAEAMPLQGVARPFDHGVWSPLSLIDPEATTPLVQISIPASWSPAQLWQLGALLTPLRSEGIAILASGAITHNLRALEWDGGRTAPWASDFVTWLESAMAAQDKSALIDYRARAPHAAMAHPHDDHLRPLFIALGAAGADQPERLHQSWDLGNLYMGSYRFG